MNMLVISKVRNMQGLIPYILLFVVDFSCGHTYIILHLARLPFKTLPFCPIFILMDDTRQKNDKKVRKMSCQTIYFSLHPPILCLSFLQLPNFNCGDDLDPKL